MKTEEAFGAALRQTRLEKELSQVALAEACTCDVSSISKLERGLTQPSLHFLLTLAKGLGVAPEELVRRTMAHGPDV